MKLDFAGQRALVTGASRGIGRATANTLHSFNAQVVASGRNQEALSSLPCPFVPWDLADAQAAGGLIHSAEAILGGPLGVLVICHASYTRMTKIHSLEYDEIQAACSTDLQATMLLIKEASQSMMGQRWGRIVLLSSLASQVGQAKAPLYSSIKGAIDALARNIAIDFGRFNITCNVVSPGFVHTERLDERTGGGDLKNLKDHTSLGRLATPQDIANVVAFLCSDAAAYITGATIPITGGAHLMNIW